MRRLSRRHFFTGLMGVAATLATGRDRAQSTTKPKRPERIIIVGGGFAGTPVALGLRRLVPRVEVVVIEKGPAFVSAPHALDYLFGAATWEEITRGYEALTSQGIRLVRADAQGIDPERHVVRTTAGALDYALLVLATGIRLASEEIAGLAENTEANTSLYDRSRVTELRRRVEAYQGGTIVLSVPPPPLQCPPVPYEFALLLAERIRHRKLKGKIILLDANTSPQPPPLSSSFEVTLEKNRDLIEYLPSARVAAVDARARRVITTDREEFAYDLLSLIPPHRASPFIQESGLAQPGDPFVQVDPLTFRSTRFETVYAVGDAARTPYARTASAAIVTAGICAQQIAATLGVSVSPMTAFQSVCYPYVSREEALELKLDYRVEGPRVESSVIVDTQPHRKYVGKRRAWQREALRQIFGA